MKRMNAIPDGGVNCMDECKVCGHKNPISEANFCFYCGASFRENADMITSEAREANSVSDTGAVIDRSTEKKPFSTLHWLGMLSLLLLGPYGWIAFLVIVLVCAFGANATEERKSFARALLIFLIIATVFLMISLSYIQSHPELLEEYNKMISTLQSAK